MKNYIILILVALFQSCSSDTNFINGTAVTWPNVYKVYPTSQQCQNNKRIYMTYGFGGNVTAYEANPFAPWLQAMIQTCAQVIVFSQPAQNQIINFQSGGAEWAKAYSEYLPKLVAEIDKKFGRSRVNIIGGVSFGGLHALMGAIQHPEIFKAFFALKPVTDWQQLIELKAMPSQHFNPLKQPSRLGQMRGYISYDLSDDRVNGALTQQLLQLIGSPSVFGQQFNNSGHTSTPDNLMPMIGFLQGI